MIRHGWKLGAAVLVAAVFGGCGRGDVPRVETFEVQMVTPVEQARQLLQRYAEGQPLGSEASTFGDLVNQVRPEDPRKAEILEKGLADLQAAPPRAVASKAKELLKDW